MTSNQCAHASVKRDTHGWRCDDCLRTFFPSGDTGAEQEAVRLRYLLNGARAYVRSFAELTQHPTARDDAMKLIERIDGLRPDETTTSRDARRYAVISRCIAPRDLYDELVRDGKSPGSWVDLQRGQSIRQKIDELCDAALQRSSMEPEDHHQKRYSRMGKLETYSGERDMTPDIKVLQELQSRLVFLAHSYRQSDRFDVSQPLSDAGEKIGAAIRAVELSQQRVAEGKTGNNT